MCMGSHLDHIRGNETNTTSPVLGWVIQDIVNVEALVLLDQLLQLLLQQNILGVDVGEDQINLGGVIAAVAGTVANDGLDDLQHGGNTSTTGNHTNVAAHVGGVDHGTLGTTDLHGLADLQGSEILRDVTLIVSLDQQVEVAGLIVGGNRSVGTDNLFGLAVNGGSERDVLTDGETKNIGGTGESKTVDSDVVRDVVDLLQHKVLELSGVQDLARLCDS